MLPYPWCLINEKKFGVFNTKTAPLYISCATGSGYESEFTAPAQEYQKFLDKTLSKHGKEMAVSGYLENRYSLLKDIPQMAQEARYYHLGVDIWAKVGTKLHCPYDCEVVVAEYEEGIGNYGGFCVIKVCLNGTMFYILFGHLNPNTLPKVGTKLKVGQIFAEIGDYHENGGWTWHLHLQVLTEKGFSDGWIHKGYCAEKDLSNIQFLCPDPSFILI